VRFRCERCDRADGFLYLKRTVLCIHRRQVLERETSFTDFPANLNFCNGLGRGFIPPNKNIGGCGMEGLSRNGPSKVRMIALGAALVLPHLALAQASPFLTGANSLQTNILAWLTPVAIILIMVLGGMAMANRISWGWAIGAVIGIAIAFGAPQIVTWVRGMFGV
jgi:type IV secretion system protein VirB2